MMDAVSAKGGLSVALSVTNAQTLRLSEPAARSEPCRCTCTRALFVRGSHYGTDFKSKSLEPTSVSAMELAQ